MFNAHSLQHLQEAAKVRRFNLRNLNAAANHCSGSCKCSRFNTIRHHAVCCAVQRINTLDFNHIWCSTLDLRAHCVEKRDEIVYLWFARSGLNACCPFCEDCGKHCILCPHHGDVREGDLCAAQPAATLRKVVAISIVNLCAERAHCINMEIDGASSNSIATRIADDDATESRKKWTEQHEARAHLGRRLQRNEEPLHVARSEIHRAI